MKITNLTKVLFLLFVMHVSKQMSYGQSWETNLDSALQKAQESGRPVLLNFSGSDWCRNCMRLELTIFSDSIFSQYSDSALVLLKMDFPRKKKNLPTEAVQAQRNLVAEKWNPEGQFPKLLLLTPTGKLISVLPYPKGGTKDLIHSIESAI